MSDNSKKRCPSQDSDSLHPSKRTKLQEGNQKPGAPRRNTDGSRNSSKPSSPSIGGGEVKRKKNNINKQQKPATQSEYDDTGWCAPSEFTKQVPQHVANDESHRTDPPKGCEEVLGLLSELTEGSTSGQTINAEFSFAKNQPSETPTRNAQTINKEDFASLSYSEKDNEGGAPFESPASISSPALVISTTPPKKTGTKKRKMQSSSITPQKASGSQGKRKVPKMPDRSRKLLNIATRQLVHRTPPRGGFNKKTTSKDNSPRKSQRIASLDHRISWKKGKKKIKKVKKKKTSSDSEEEEGEEESSGYELEFDSELEARLEENAAKNNLTAINVKSILHVSF